jgi:hypothetical protein
MARPARPAKSRSGSPRSNPRDGWHPRSVTNRATPNRPKKVAGITDAQGAAMNEVECYDWEIANAAKNGLTKAEIDELKKTRKAYYDQLDAANKKRVDGGAYTLP